MAVEFHRTERMMQGDDQHRVSDETYVLLREYVRERTGIVYNPSRRSIFESRLLTRVHSLGLADVESYYRYLRFHPRREDEFLELSSVLTNNETFFFREEGAVQAIVDLLAQKPKNRRLRVLSAGSSSGEELNSVAMVCKEQGLDLDRVDFFGVDLDVRMVATAREGLYRSKSFRKTEPERSLRFFVPEGEGRRVKPAIHSHLEFRWANLVDPSTLRFPHPFDAILCRNVLIYFDGPTVERVVRTLHGLLVEDGILAVGVSESLAHIPFLFDPLRHKGEILYKRIPL